MAGCGIKRSWADHLAEYHEYKKTDLYPEVMRHRVLEGTLMTQQMKDEGCYVYRLDEKGYSWPVEYHKPVPTQQQKDHWKNKYRLEALHDTARGRIPNWSMRYYCTNDLCSRCSKESLLRLLEQRILHLKGEIKLPFHGCSPSFCYDCRRMYCDDHGYDVENYPVEITPVIEHYCDKWSKGRLNTPHEPTNYLIITDSNLKRKYIFQGTEEYEREKPKRK